MGRPLRVLVVEDSEDDTLLLIRQLRRTDFSVSYERVETPRELQRALEQDQWDVVLADWNLPAFGGLEALAHFKQAGKDIPFIIVSGTIQEDAAVAAMKAGAQDYIRKESPARLVPAIERELQDTLKRREMKRLREERAQLEARERQARAEAEAAQAIARMKSEFLNMVSHELRTPLTSVIGFTEFLREGLGGPLSDDQSNFLAQVEAGLGRLVHVVDDLLDFARMEAGTFSLMRGPVDFGQQLRELVESFQPQATYFGQRIELELASDELICSLDSQRINQVVINLVGNAIKFTPRGGTIWIRAFRTSEGVTCEVEDSGPGIAPEDISKLFQPYTQLTEGKRKGGSGLGLAISKALVEAHGGKIGVHSAVGEGGQFWFSIPFHPDTEVL